MSDPSTRLPLAELEKTQEYQRLTQKQKLFVATYCESGLTTGTYDAIQATLTAYQCKSAEVARIMSYSLLANIRIVAALNRHFNTSPIEEFLVMLDRAISNKKLTMAQLGALKMRCDLLGFGTRLPNKQSIGAIPDDILAESRKPKGNAPKDLAKPKKGQIPNVKV